jgi:hypothetical protein
MYLFISFVIILTLQNINLFCAYLQIIIYFTLTYFILIFRFWAKINKTCKNYNKNSAKLPNFKEKLRKVGAFCDNLPIFGQNYQKKWKFSRKKELMLIAKIFALPHRYKQKWPNFPSYSFWWILIWIRIARKCRKCCWGIRNLWKNGCKWQILMIFIVFFYSLINKN